MRAKIEELLPEISEFRHRLHRIPEPAGAEVKTSALIRDELANLDLEVLPPFIGTDVVAILRGSRPGRNVTLRADIDALALEETTGAPYASTHPGMMHACGHDAHSAILMGAAKVLAAAGRDFAGSIRFVWQPGEENRAMARELIAAGALNSPEPDLVAALHLLPGLPVGTFGIREGAMMASCTHFRVKFRGRSGHGSRPAAARNPIVAAAAAVGELNIAVTTRIDALRSPTLSVCAISGGKLDNVIPDEAEIRGTMRAIDLETADELAALLREVCCAVARLHRVEVDVELERGYPPTVNNAAATPVARRALEQIGAKWVELPEPSLTAEDFAWYLCRWPGVFLRLGSGEDSPELHNCAFDAPDAALAPGIAWLVAFARLGLDA